MPKTPIPNSPKRTTVPGAVSPPDSLDDLPIAPIPLSEASSRTRLRGERMATTPQAVTIRRAARPSELQEKARRHLWMHFTRMGGYDESHEIPLIVRGEGSYVYDEHGNRYMDGLSALFCVNAGHGRAELGEAAARQAKELGFYTNWSYAHPDGDRAGRAHRRRSRRATSTACSSRRAARRPSSRPGRWRASTTSSRGSLGQVQDHLARDRLPRHHLRRALDHGHHSSAHAVRAARTGRLPRAQHERLPLGGGPRPALGGRPDRARDRVPGPGHGRGRDPRAGPELGRLLRARRTATGSACARSATATTCC